MKKLLAMAVTALVAHEVFAQNVKNAVITFSLTAQEQASVSASRAANNAGTWEAGPLYYKTGKAKLTALNVIQCIAKVLRKNPGYYSSKAALVLSQSELSGFFNVGTDLGEERFPSNSVPAAKPGGPYAATPFASTIDGLVTHLDNGRHFKPNPNTGSWPPGHHQPWGQIFVQDPVKGTCDNVTFFFSLTVEECYDCFYLSSFISDSTFVVKSGGVVGPPCCGTSVNLLGNGQDYYYLHLFFDNTSNNPYLNSASEAYVGVEGRYAGIEPVDAEDFDLPSDGLTPDLLVYNSAIASGLGKFEKYIMRFAIRGIVTYKWSLKFINSSDVLPDFVGKAVCNANGHGFIALTCQLLTGSAAITEAVARISACCINQPWYDDGGDSSWYGTGWDQARIFSGFASPVNTPVDLGFHLPFEEER